MAWWGGQKPPTSREVPPAKPKTPPMAPAAILRGAIAEDTKQAAMDALLRVAICPLCKAPSLRDARGAPTFKCANHHSWWQPLPSTRGLPLGPQGRFLSLTCLEALYGGSAGPGKTDCLLIDALRYVGRGYGADYHALLLRRTFPEVNKSLIKRSKQLYPRLGGKFNKADHVWTFPGGEIVEFGHAQHEDDIHAYHGAAVQYIGFDELTTFTKYQYTYMFSRCRSARGVPCRIRGATNPGGEGQEWVFLRYSPWLDRRDEYAGVRGSDGEILYFLRSDDEDELVAKGTPMSIGRTFVPAQLEDNPMLFFDGQYERALQELDPVSFARQRHGDWLIQPGRGMYFKRANFASKFVDAIPIRALRLRYWDRAASVDGDWTVGLKMSMTSDRDLLVEDIVRFRGEPATVEANLVATAEFDGKGVIQCLELDPGQAGKAEMAYLIQALQGFDARSVPKRIDKITAAGPVSAQCAVGNISLLRAKWNEPLIVELEAFPEGKYDDQVDAFSGAFSALMEMAPGPILLPTKLPVGSYRQTDRGF